MDEIYLALVCAKFCIKETEFLCPNFVIIFTYQGV
jgi:hypothetical protein